LWRELPIRKACLSFSVLFALSLSPVTDFIYKYLLTSLQIFTDFITNSY
jgi:hypothetical protein